MRGLKFNNKHSFTDFGLILEKKSIQPPSKKKIKVEVPFMNSSYDFSTVATGGEQVYTHREVTVIFGLPTKSKQQLQVLYSKILSWLEDVPQSQLIFDDMADLYFLAEVENAPSFEEMLMFGKLTVTFICEPFKFGVNLEGVENIKWDSFNFETDYMTPTQFTVAGTQAISLYNSGRVVTPTINCSAAMTAKIGTYTANLVAGDNKDWRFRLQPGENLITVTGSGTIKFNWRKEVI